MRRACVIPGALVVAILLGACPSPFVFPGPAPNGASAPMYGDTMVDIAARLVTSVSLIDSAGRARGALPERLDGILPARWLRDIFGNPIQYSPDGWNFTLRSPGGDRIADTGDDVFVTGRLGRSVPCELRQPGYVSFFHEQAPLCRDVPILVLPICRDAEYLPVPEFSARYSRVEERVRETGERLVLLARRLDGKARALGALPPASGTARPDFRDAWGRPVEYRVAEQSFLLVSPGADGILDTTDDISVEAALGASIPCMFAHGDQQISCDIPPPTCP